MPTVLPAILAPLSESDTALATALCAFLRSFGLMVRICHSRQEAYNTPALLVFVLHP